MAKYFLRKLCSFGKNANKFILLSTTRPSYPRKNDEIVFMRFSVRKEYSWTHVIRIPKGPKISFELHEFRTKWVFIFWPDLMKTDFLRFISVYFFLFSSLISEILVQSWYIELHISLSKLLRFSGDLGQKWKQQRTEEFTRHSNAKIVDWHRSDIWLRKNKKSNFCQLQS